MNKFTKMTFIVGLLLLIFPLLGFPELWENIYVLVIGFFLAYQTLIFKKKNSTKPKQEKDEEAGLKVFAKKMQKKIKEASEASDLPELKQKSSISSAIKKHDK